MTRWDDSTDTGVLPHLSRREWRTALLLTGGLVLYIGYGPALLWWLLGAVS
jgi:hypothetical protein